MFCIQCGTQLTREQRFCTNCGSSLEIRMSTADSHLTVPSSPSVTVRRQAASGPTSDPSLEAARASGSNATSELAAEPPEPSKIAAHRREISSLLLPGGVGVLAVVAIVLVPLFLNSRTQPRASNARIERPVTATIQSDLVLRETPVDNLASPASLSLARKPVLPAASAEPKTIELQKETSPGSTKTAAVTYSEAAPGISSTSYRVGAQPTGMLFDGNYIWVSNNSSNSVTKLQPDDGRVLGTFSTGSYPVGLAFDGANIWVANFGFNGAGNTATVLSARTGRPASFSPVPVGQGPRGLTFDGANIWAADSAAGRVTKVRASDGILLGTYIVGPGPECLTFDGANIWVTNRDDRSVSKLRASDGKAMGTFPTGSGPFGITFAAGHIWVANADSKVTELSLDGSVLRTAAVGNGASWVAFDGANIWVASQNSHTVTEVQASDGQVLGMLPMSGNPWGVVFDGANIWVSNFVGGNVWKLYPTQTADAEEAWLGFANGNAAQDRDLELHRNCGNFNRVEVPYSFGNNFKNLCGYVNKSCEKVCDWEGHILSCDSVSMGGRRDGTRVALCR
jgi:hypothetical protein